MSQQLDDAIEVLTSTFLSLQLVARSLHVDAQEVADALKTATPDTSEYIALLALADCNPIKEIIKQTTQVDQEET